MLAAFRVDALGNDGGRPQNGTASTGKLNHSNVRCGKASNLKLTPAAWHFRLRVVKPGVYV
jgi:hypothetical protein